MKQLTPERRRAVLTQVIEHRTVRRHARKAKHNGLKIIQEHMRKLRGRPQS